MRNVEENQNVLLNALRARNLIGKKFILDGHCCLLNADNGVQKIDKSVFEQLELGGIIVLYEDEKVIWERLKRRDGLELDIYLLEEFQQAEIMYAKQLAEEIGIPYLMTKNEEEKISAFINSVWR